MTDASARRGEDDDEGEDRVRIYKRMLERILDARPSGTRLRLAHTLGKNRSFVSQIANPVYSTPIPSQHLLTIFDVCRFSPEERRAFLDAYAQAHPRRHLPHRDKPHLRTIAVTVPDLGDPGRNRAIDDMVADFARKLSLLTETIALQTKEESKP